MRNNQSKKSPISSRDEAPLGNGKNAAAPLKNSFTKIPANDSPVEAATGGRSGGGVSAPPKVALPVENAVKEVTKTEVEQMREKSEREKKSEEARRHREELRFRKTVVHELEEKNYSKLYFINTNGNWYILIRNSMTMYYNLVAPRIGKRPNIRVDNQPGKRSYEGIISFPDLKAVTEKMKAINIKRVARPRELPKGIVVFDLGVKIDQERMVELREHASREMKKIRQQIQPEEVFPSLGVAIDEMVKIVCNNFLNVPKLIQETLGKRIINLALDIQRDYILMVNKRLKAEDVFPVIDRCTIEMLTVLKAVAELTLWETDRLSRNVEKIVHVKNEVDDIVTRTR